MKANELMLKDWVFIFDPDYNDDKEAYQVSEVREGGIRTRMFTDLYEEGWFEPIPLTKDILAKNGFRKIREFEWQDGINVSVYRYSSSDLEEWFEIKYIPSYNVFNWKGCEVNMVHQFQHALRLCGLNELANNFQI